MANALAKETSPYLLQHKDNPVAWVPWGQAAFEQAIAENKPILLSVGYSACHWCHVMARECFEDDTIAKMMNEKFVSVKVDREERPDIDAIYQSALSMMGEQGGWPLTMFLTPRGEPFWGGTYFPPSAKNGRPGLLDILAGIHEAFTEDPEKVEKNSAALRDGLQNLSKARRGKGISLKEIDQAAHRLVREVDLYNGGVGRAPKFPQPNMFEYFWRAWKRTAHEPFRQAVTTTLTNMCQGGIYDHLGGGFARYSTDEHWLVPHFEKMLSDNAQLIELMTLVWQDTQDPLLAMRVEETVTWALREMRSGYGFASALDAETEGEEGRYYVWTQREIDEILGRESSEFAITYNVTFGGNWQGRVILNRTREPQIGNSKYEQRLKASREKLLAVRDQRTRPHRDDKVLADWNGMMISALVSAGLAFGRYDWVEAAQTTFNFVMESLVSGSVQERMQTGGRLTHSWCNGRATNPATLDDYAQMIRAAIVLFEASSDQRYLQKAGEWVAILDNHFADPDGGYFFTADDTVDVIARLKTASDNPTPSGNAVMAINFLKSFYITGDSRARDRAEAIIKTFAGEMSRNFFPLTSLMNAAEFLHRATQIVLIGAPDDPELSNMRATILSTSLPNRVLTYLPPGGSVPKGHPAFGKRPKDDRATAFVCVGPTCSQPITSASTLADELAKTG
ncbi:MAG: thioredoxin domain-containing protein [Pseudomonadota bacterium]